MHHGYLRLMRFDQGDTHYDWNGYGQAANQYDRNGNDQDINQYCTYGYDHQGDNQCNRYGYEQADNKNYDVNRDIVSNQRHQFFGNGTYININCF